MTLELCNWVVHMGNWYKVLKGGLHTSLQLLSGWVHSVPVGVQYTILKTASRRSFGRSRQYLEMRAAQSCAIG